MIERGVERRGVHVAATGAGNGVLAHLRPLGLLIRERARKHNIHIYVGSSISSTCAELMIGCRWSCIGNVFAFPVVHIYPVRKFNRLAMFITIRVRLYFYF